jgi:type IX secretion system PorP/SprF family membrane protein
MRGIKNISTQIATVLLLTGLTLFGGIAHAQQDPVYTQYMNNLMSVNPAYTGLRGVGSASTIFRKQWLGLSNSPTTSSITMSMPFDSLHTGVGFDFLFDDIGKAITTTGLFFNYSYRVRATATTQLSFGLKGGFNYLQAYFSQLDRYHLDDTYLMEFGDFNSFLPNFGVGLFWYGNDFYVGLSVPRLLENPLNKRDVTTRAASREERHYLLQAAYIYKLSPYVTFKPGLSTILVSGAPATADFDFSFLFYDKVWFGAMYRISDAVGAYAQFQVENIKIGFSYDYSHTRLSNYNSGTFEVMLRYDFKTKETQVLPFLGF